MAAQVTKAWWDIKSKHMKDRSHNLLVFFHHGFISEEEETGLRNLIFFIESPEQFCIAHELVDRNRITSNRKKILKEAGRKELRTFRFLINKN